MAAGMTTRPATSTDLPEMIAWHGAHWRQVSAQMPPQAGPGTHLKDWLGRVWTTETLAHVARRIPRKPHRLADFAAFDQTRRGTERAPVDDPLLRAAGVIRPGSRLFALRLRGRRV
jgi:tRNA U34 5-methylaminomethyl-2-thiouridine-forming methyltransferase MnmC